MVDLFSFLILIITDIRNPFHLIISRKDNNGVFEQLIMIRFQDRNNKKASIY